MDSCYIESYLTGRKGCLKIQSCRVEIIDNQLSVNQQRTHSCKYCRNRIIVKVKNYLFLLLDIKSNTCEIFNFRRKAHNLIINDAFFEAFTENSVTLLPENTFDNRYDQLQYLESRINNPDWTGKQCLLNISNKEAYKVLINDFWMIKRDCYEKYVYYTNSAKCVLNYSLQPPTSETSINKEFKGVILGHGHKHNTPILPESFPNVTWTLVDIDPSSQPDLVGGYGCMETIQILGLHNWDYVFASYCPWKGDTIFRGARNLLNNKGQFILNNFIKRDEAVNKLEEQSKLYMQRNFYQRHSHQDNFSIFYV